jgi:hypothetical protein
MPGASGDASRAHRGKTAVTRCGVVGKRQYKPQYPLPPNSQNPPNPNYLQPPRTPLPASLECRVRHLQECCRAAAAANEDERLRHALLRALIPCQRALQGLLAPASAAPSGAASLDSLSSTSALPPVPSLPPSSDGAARAAGRGASPTSQGSLSPASSAAAADALAAAVAAAMAAAPPPPIEPTLLAEVDARAADLAQLLGRRSVPVCGAGCPPSGLLLRCVPACPPARLCWAYG